MADIKILLVDDNEAIHTSFNKIFNEKSDNNQLAEIENMLFDPNKAKHDISNNQYSIKSAYQGEQALKLIEESLKNNNKYSIAFVDIRMPPGIDGIETIKQLWKLDADLPVVIISADFDYSFDDISHHLQHSKNYLILKKPFDIFEIKQMVNMFSR